MTRRKHKEHKPAGIAPRSLGTTPGTTQPMVSLSGTPMPVAGPDVIELTERNFGSSIDGHPFAVIDFWAPSSALCRAFAPTFAAAAARNPDVLFAQVNAEDQQAMVEQFDIRSFPTLIIFRSNIIVYAKAGALEARALDEVLAAARALDMEQVRRKVVSVDTVAVGAATAPTTDVHAQAAADARLLSIETYLRPSVRAALKDAGPLLAAGGLVAIRDAFEPDFAERIYRSLDSCTTWRLYEGYEEHFHYHHHNVYEIARISSGPRLVLQDIRLVEYEGVGDAAVRSFLSWTGGGLRELVPSRRPFPPSQRCSGQRRKFQSSSRLRVASGKGLAIGVGRRVVLVLEGMLPAAGLQHPMAIQRGAGIEPLRDSRLTVRPGQAPRRQWMVDGTGRDTQSSLERPRPNPHRQFGNRDLLNQVG